MAMQRELDDFASRLTIDETLTPVSPHCVGVVSVCVWVWLVCSCSISPSFRIVSVTRVLFNDFMLFLQEQQANKLKNEKLKIAMLKLKEASVHKVIP